MKRPDQMTREELEEEVAYLRSELGPRGDHDRDKIMAALKTTVAETCLLSTLYAEKGRPVSNWRLAESSPPGRMTEDRNDIAAVKVWVSRLRKKLGADTITTIFSLGYALTPRGIALVDAALGNTPQQQRSA